MSKNVVTDVVDRLAARPVLALGLTTAFAAVALVFAVNSMHPTVDGCGKSDTYIRQALASGNNVRLTCQ